MVNTKEKLLGLLQEAVEEAKMSVIEPVWDFSSAALIWGVIREEEEQPRGLPSYIGGICDAIPGRIRYEFEILDRDKVPDKALYSRLLIVNASAGEDRNIKIDSIELDKDIHMNTRGRFGRMVQVMDITESPLRPL